MTEQAVYEWEFDVPSSEVDLERLESEILDLPAIVGEFYIGKLRIKAPIVYSRLVERQRSLRRMSTSP